MESRKEAIKALRDMGYFIIPPTPTEERIVTAAEEIERAAERIAEMCDQGGRITPLAADKIERARELINSAWDRQQEKAA